MADRRWAACAQQGAALDPGRHLGRARPSTNPRPGQYRDPEGLGVGSTAPSPSDWQVPEPCLTLGQRTQTQAKLGPWSDEPGFSHRHCCPSNWRAKCYAVCSQPGQLPGAVRAGCPHTLPTRGLPSTCSVSHPTPGENGKPGREARDHPDRHCPSLRSPPG